MAPSFGIPLLCTFGSLSRGLPKFNGQIIPRHEGTLKYHPFQRQTRRRVPCGIRNQLRGICALRIGIPPSYKMRSTAPQTVIPPYACRRVPELFKARLQKPDTVNSEALVQRDTKDSSHSSEFEVISTLDHLIAFMSQTEGAWASESLMMGSFRTVKRSAEFRGLSDRRFHLHLSMTLCDRQRAKTPG